MQRARRVQEEVLNDVEQLDKNNSNVNNVKLFKNMLQKQFNDSLNVLSTEIHEHAKSVTEQAIKIRPARESILKGLELIVDAVFTPASSATPVLYGSCASGLDTKDSDLDVVISFRSSPEFEEIESASETDPTTLIDAKMKIQMLATYIEDSVPWIKINKVVWSGLVPVIKATGFVGKNDCVLGR